MRRHRRCVTECVIDGLQQEPALVCKKKNCKSKTTVYRCAVKDCSKCSCVACYNAMLKKYKLIPTTNDKGEIVVVCTPSHHANLLKKQEKTSKKDSPSLVTQVTKAGWNNDGKNGRNDPNTSEQILMNWLLEEGNFAAYCKCDFGMTKKNFATKIADTINRAGVLCKRDAKQVLNKIGHIQKLFRATRDWAYNTTGQGLKEESPFYYELELVMGGRASASPIIDAEKGLSSSDDDNSSQSDNLTRKWRKTCCDLEILLLIWRRRPTDMVQNW
jgi:hypothetical protein